MVSIRFLYCSIILGLVEVCDSSAVTVIGLAGSRVTLHCRYTVEVHGLLSACWGKAHVPASKCLNTVVSTRYGEVSFRKSERYQSLGKLTKGDVSLTIVNATEQDSGFYGCRIEIPGLFNDIKHNFHLLILNDTPEPLGTAQQTGKWKSASPDISSEQENVVVSQVQTQKKNQTFIENCVRIGAVILIPVVIITIMGLQFFKMRKLGCSVNVMQAPAV